MTKDNTTKPAAVAGTIKAALAADRSAVAVRAQAELIEMLARLVLQRVEVAADRADDGQQPPRNAHRGRQERSRARRTARLAP